MLNWLERVAGRRRISERGINWVEHYTEKSAALKKRFDRDIGLGAYFRWEGFDYTTSHPYYVVVGPAVSRRHGKMFFAGVKRLPRERRKKAYSPSGKYFPTMRAAMTHATKMWGVKYPENTGDYNRYDLAPVKIPRHMKG